MIYILLSVCLYMVIKTLQKKVDNHMRVVQKSPVKIKKTFSIFLHFIIFFTSSQSLVQPEALDHTCNVYFLAIISPHVHVTCMLPINISCIPCTPIFLTLPIKIHTNLSYTTYRYTNHCPPINTARPAPRYNEKY